MTGQRPPKQICPALGLRVAGVVGEEAAICAGEPTGLYDEATVEAMRQFQTMSRIDVTGYPTAHSLKRLGLTHW